MSDLHGLGQRVAAVQDRQVAALGAAEKAREGFLGRETFAPAEPRWMRSSWTLGRRPLVALVAAALVGAAATFALLGWRERALVFAVGDEPFSGAAGRQVASPADRPVPVHFSDGSQAELEAGSSLVISALDRAGAALTLEHGRAVMEVVHRTSTHWSLRAGPYTVDVTGTRFELAWQPEAARLAVRLDEGRVVVSGGRLASPVQVESGQVLIASADTWKLAPESDLRVSEAGYPRRDPPGVEVGDPRRDPPGTDTAGSDDAKLPSALVPPADAPAGNDPPSDPAAEARAPLERPAPSKRWQQLAEAGKYDEAMTVAERDGFDATCRSVSASDLMTLSEAARLGRRPARARQALLVLRERFPGDAQASTAAFFLGRMAGDREAVSWFRAYLREAPSGALRREASGRLLEALSRSGDGAAASEAARSYLKQYPRGPHAALAERLARP